MSLAETPEQKHEIIIIRRPRHDEDEAHHGGVWKIAFADFMTAMMCFFLVMWLINAANEQTKAAVASYFNPVKLVDRNSSRKGLEDLGDGPHAIGLTAEDPTETDGKGGVDGRGNAGPSTEENSADSADTQQHSDEHLFSDPYAVLAEIAADTGVMQNLSAKGDGGAQLSGPSTGASGGESYRDPFAPNFWSQEVAGAETAEPNTPEKIAEPEPVVKAETDTSATKGAPPEVSPLEQVSPAKSKPEPVARVEADQPAAERAPAPEPKPAAKGNSPTPETLKAADQIRQELAGAFEPGEKLAEGLSVVATDKGVTISVTDQFDFGMFEIGSAVPRRELVLAMEKIGKMLSAHKGSLTISGHTDSRPFKSDTYDNWRLSTARAHSAYYMLVRAGLDDRRITEVSGYADRKLKDTADSFAAGNRRIEILLETGG